MIEKQIIDSINDRGTEKLQEIPLALRDMADVIERRLAASPDLQDANHMIVVNLRTLDSHIQLLQESASSSLRDLVRILRKDAL